MNTPNVTIAVVPRERFSHTARSLESIYAHTDFPFELVYVDGGSPAPVARYLQDQARAMGFSLLRTDYYLSPNEARNLALERANTKYIVFIDNDVLVSPGWLQPLVECADETEAWIVGPLVMFGETGFDQIHHAGGAVSVKDVEGRRLFFEEHYQSEKVLQDVAPLSRQTMGVVEFHCMLVRRECFQQLGKLDEQLLTMYEHMDLCMAVSAAGEKIYLEPKAVVGYVPARVLALSDLPYYFLRWSEDWNAITHQRFQAKWELAPDDPFTSSARDWVTQYRQSPLWAWRPLVDRLTRGRSYMIERRLFAPLEMRISRFVAGRAGRNRPMAAGNVRVSGTANEQ